MPHDLLLAHGRQRLEDEKSGEGIFNFRGFCHCLDHLAFLDAMHNLLNPNGGIVFAAGLNIDRDSL